MNYETYSNLVGKHAMFSPSSTNLLDKDENYIVGFWARKYIPEIGTALHDIARAHIKNSIKLTKYTKSEVLLALIDAYKIPLPVIKRAIDFDDKYKNLMIYVNDTIKYRMIPEQILYFSKLIFGTADAISTLDDIERTGVLRIHDLKTGTTQAKMTQLENYAALFCLNYKYKPKDLEMELRIYQSGEVLCHNPDPKEISELMDQYRKADRLINDILMEDL